MPLIYGRNPIIEAIENEKTINKIYFQKGNSNIQDIKKLAIEKKILVVEAEKSKLDTMIEGKNSQGIVASVTEYKYAEVEDIIEYAKSKNEQPLIMILDKIEDPHNLGAIIRSAECAGFHGVIIAKRNSCPVNDTVEKVSVGAIEYVKVARVVNITQTINKLKELGLWIYGLDMDGESSIYNTKFDGAIGLVVGNEGAGISRLVKENCDVIINIPMFGKINSLNASVSSALAMYEVKKKVSKL